MAVAVMDILGFRSLIDRSSVDEVVQIINNSIRAAVGGCSVVQHDLDCFSDHSGKEAPQLDYLQFSDTIFMYLTVTEHVPKVLCNPARMVTSLSYVVSLTIAHCIVKDIPLRGAIAYGPCYVSRTPLFFVGKPIVEAFDLEKAQQWVGASIARSAELSLERHREEIRHKFLVPYDVPLKAESSVPTPKYAVNWAASIPAQGRRYVSCRDPKTGELTIRKYSPPAWDRIFDESIEDVKEKRTYTEAFFNEFKDIYGPITVG